MSSAIDVLTRNCKLYSIDILITVTAIYFSQYETIETAVDNFKLCYRLYVLLELKISLKICVPFILYLFSISGIVVFEVRVHVFDTIVHHRRKLYLTSRLYIPTRIETNTK